MNIGYIKKINILISDKVNIENNILRVQSLTFKDYERHRCNINNVEIYPILELIHIDNVEKHLDAFKISLIESLKEKLYDIEKELSTYTITKQ